MLKKCAAALMALLLMLAGLAVSWAEDAAPVSQDPVNKEEITVKSFKPLSQHNPVMVQRFGADPWAMVYDGRVYLYMTGDEPVIGKDGKPAVNNYGNITTLRILSSDDLVNWTDHGSVKATGLLGAARWAANSWAPCAAWKNINGQDKFFLYFANSGGGIGVLTADSPTGPFTDPLFGPLISRNTPTCDTVTWLFDPAVLMDDDGSAYLYFGGGIPVLSPIMNDLAGNRFSNIMGIVNGTTNYILTQMTENGMAYEDALKEVELLKQTYESLIATHNDLINQFMEKINK